MTSFGIVHTYRHFDVTCGSAGLIANCICISGQWRRKRYSRYGVAIPICWNLGSWFSRKSLKLLPPNIRF